MLGLWKAPKGLTDELYGFTKSKNVLFYDSAFTAHKRDVKF